VNGYDLIRGILRLKCQFLNVSKGAFIRIRKMMNVIFADKRILLSVRYVTNILVCVIV